MRLASVVYDLRFALRQIVRRPLASITIVSVLALGIGVHSTLFAVLQSLTTRPAPGVRADDALVRLRGKQQPLERGRWLPRPFSYAEYRAIADRHDLFAATTAWTTETVTLEFGDAASATSAQTHFVTGQYFHTAGVRIAHGTTLPLPGRADGNRGEMVAIVGDALWRDLLGASPDAIGRTIRINNALVRIVGVAPPKFNGLAPSTSSRTIWMPLASRAAVVRDTRDALIHRDSALLAGAALLAPDVPMERASTAVQLIAGQAVSQMTSATDGRIRTADVVPLRGSTELPVNSEALLLSIGVGLAGLLILVMACTNVSALIIGAGVGRSHEIAIRLSLGASRARIVRQLLTESCLLAVGGAVTGLAVHSTALRFVGNSIPDLELSLDFATLGFTLLVALGTGLLFGLSPALHATRRNVGDVLKAGRGATGSAARTRLQSSLVAAQIAVTQPLLVGIVLLLALARTAGSRQVDHAVSDRVVRLTFDIWRAAPSLHAKLRVAMRDIETLPGVERAVADAWSRGSVDLAVLPDSRADLVREGSISARLEGTSPGYFELFDVPILRGRDVALADTAQRDLAVVIGSDLARELWGSADPIGRRFQRIERGEVLSRAAEVVGVYDASKGMPRSVGHRVFAIDNDAWRDNSYLVRTTGPGRAVMRSIRERLGHTLPELPVAHLATLTDALAEERREAVQLGAAAGAGGALVLLLASIGLYGVIALAVAQRRREIGIRIALGARPTAVVALLFRQGVRLGATGLVTGLPASIAALIAIGRIAGATADMAIGEQNPPLIGAVIACTVLLVASLATWVPARRAAAVDPAQTLRSD